MDRALTIAQSTSAVLFGGFLLLHIPASLASNLGEREATQLMLIGRELYQSDLLEPLFLGSAAVHVSSGLLRRCHRHGLKSFSRLSLHAISGYLLVPFLSFHVYLHRWLPLRQEISSDISYSFTSLFLQSYPVLGWVHYSCVSILAATHVLGGIRAISSNRRKKAIVFSKHTRSWEVSWALLVGGLGLGLVRLSKSGIDGFVLGKYEKVLRAALP